MGFAILVVCTANICRSPTGARGLQVGLWHAGVPSDLVSVESAGVAAGDDWPMCELADTMTTAALGEGGNHRSRRLTAELANEAGLILVADRGHRTAVGQLAPATRGRTFTIRQAARLAAWVVGDAGVLGIAEVKAAGGTPDLDPDDLRLGVPALPTAPRDRLGWFVAELDAARGLAPLADAGDYPDCEPDDIGDPHVAGWYLHDVAVPCALAAAEVMVLALCDVLGMP